MAVTTWDGSSSTDWNTAANWDTGAIPTSADDVIIPDDSTTANNCTLSATGGNPKNVKSLQIQANGTVVGGGIQIRVYGENGSGFAVDNDGIISGNLNLEIKTPSTTDIDLAGTSGNFNNLKINDASCIATMKSDCILDGDLDMAAGQLTTGVGGYGFSNLTVGGATTLANNTILKCNTSTVDLTGGNVTGSGTGTLALDTCTLTAGNLYPKKITADAASVTCSDYFGVSTNTDLTVSSGAALAVSCRRLQLNSVTATSPNWSVTFVGDLASRTIKLGSGELHDVTLNMTADATDIQHLGQNTTIGGNLTITSGVLDTNENSGDNFSLTVTGHVSVAGTLTGNESVISMKSLTIAATGTYSATNQTTTINGEGDGTGGSSNGFALYNTADGTFTHNNGMVAITTNTNTVVYGMEGDDTSGSGANAFNRLQIELTNAVYFVKLRPAAGTAHVIKGNVTVAEGILQTETDGHTLTIEGDVSIESGGTLGHADHDAADSFKSLTISSGGTCIGSEGTTTITGESGSGVNLSNSGTFTHNQGTVKVTCATQTTLVGFSGTNAFYNYTYAGTGSGEDQVLGGNTDFFGHVIVDSANSELQSQGHTFNYYGGITIKQGGWDIGSSDESGTVNVYGGVRNVGGSIVA